MSDEPYRLRIDVRLRFEGLDLRAEIDTHRAAVAILGPSGAGKSTLLRILAGLERRADGRVEVRGSTWQESASGTWVPPWERGVGWVPQDALLFPHLDVRQNLAYAGASEGDVRDVARLLEVGDLLSRRPRNLSGGERQRVALGRALLAAPSLLLLDEPLSALDRPLRAEVARRLAERLRATGTPLVLVSHDEEDAAALAAERWRLADGRLTRG